MSKLFGGGLFGGLFGKVASQVASAAIQAPAPAKPKNEDVALRAQTEGQRAVGGAVADSANDQDELFGLSSGKKQRSAGREILG